MEEEAGRYMTLGRRLAAEHAYDKAVELFLSALESSRGVGGQHEDELRALLAALNRELAPARRFRLMFHNFGRALALFPRSAHLLNDVGERLYELGRLRGARKHFEGALRTDPDHVDAERNLNSVKNLLVERWHFRMLNDRVRNEAYGAAVRAGVRRRGARVLDVGTGSGLLALHARDAGARALVAVDCSRVMAACAARRLRRAALVLTRRSTELRAADVGGRCSLLLTETFDAGLLGEGALRTLAHAWAALLAPGAAVVPAGAEFFVQGARSDLLAKNYRLCPTSKEILRIPSLDVRAETGDETYDCEDVRSIPDLVYMTEPRSLVRVNFNDFDDVRTLLERIEPIDVELRAEEDGVVDAVLGWFNLYLSESVSITTDPRAERGAGAWQQAVFFDDTPRRVTRNAAIPLRFLVNGGKLTMIPTGVSDVRRVSSDMIRFLNDVEYVRSITECAEAVRARLGRDAAPRVADLCPFPAFGLAMMRRGARSLLCRAVDVADKLLIVRVCEANGVRASDVTVVLGDEGTADALGDARFDAIMAHWLLPCGDVDAARAAQLPELRARLARGGVLLPARTSLVAQLAASAQLAADNRVYAERVGRPGIARFMNRYRVTQNFSVDLSRLRHEPLCRPAVLCRYPEGARREAAAVSLEADGRADAILCWYDIQLEEGSSTISTNRPGSFMDGMLFVTYSEQPLSAGRTATIIQHKNGDGRFKLVVEFE